MWISECSNYSSEGTKSVYNVITKSAKKDCISCVMKLDQLPNNAGLCTVLPHQAINYFKKETEKKARGIFTRQRFIFCW